MDDKYSWIKYLNEILPPYNKYDEGLIVYYFSYVLDWHWYLAKCIGTVRDLSEKEKKFYFSFSDNFTNFM